MPTGYKRSPKFLKGALVELTEKLLLPVPNIIMFQYNPQTLTRSMKPFARPTRTSEEQAEATEESGPSETPETAQPFDPTETFSLDLELDATDDLEEPQSHPVAIVSGVADRIAAMEMLLYPQKGSVSGGELLGTVSTALAGGAEGEETEELSRGEVPIVLFVWGPGRIVPVRLTSFSVEEQFFSPTLYPIHANVSIGLKVLTPGNLPTEDSTSKDLAKFAYKWTLKQKELLATANIANAVDSILGLLPF